MRHYPDSEYDWKEAKRLGAEDWMLDALKLNPDYCSWGPEEDYMASGTSWNSPQFIDKWTGSTTWELNDLNEVVNFYFLIGRTYEDCSFCGASGFNPETAQIEKDYYDFDRIGRRWRENITQDETDALWDAGRLRSFKNKPTAAEVNVWASHDAINRMILIETRAKRLGVYGMCEHCGGNGYLYTEPEPHLGIVLWGLHPRKGAGRGIQIRHIEREQLHEVKAFLRQAADRNAQRFSKIDA